MPFAASARSRRWPNLSIDDPNREFVTSDILCLELIPKPHHFGRTAEQFFEDFFAAAVECVETAPTLVQAAEAEAKA